MSDNKPVPRMVRVNSFHGPIDRVVVEERGGVLVICRLEEYRAALTAGRKPSVVGFKVADLIAELGPLPADDPRHD